MRGITSANSALDLPGARRARLIAREVLAEVKDAIGLPPSRA